MADEAVLRIVLQDQGTALDVGGARQPTQIAPSQPRQRPAPTAEPPFDPAKEAQKRFEADKRRAAVDLEYAKFQPTKIPFDPAEEARKRLEADKKRWAVDAEYAKLVPPEPPTLEAAFDPVAEAQKRREAEQRAAQIDAAYKQQYGGQDKKTQLDQLLKVADSLRGTIGGLAGTTVGAALDVAVGFRKAQVEATKEKDKADLLKGIAPSGGTTTATKSAPTAAAAEGAGGEAAAGAAGAAGAEAAGGAAAAGGGMAAAAAAAGPIGAIVIAAKAIKDTIDKAVIGSIKSTIGTVGAVAAGIASANPDPSVPIAQASDAVSKFGEKITEYVPILGYMVVATGEAGKAFATLMQALDKTAERYGEYSPEIAQAQAIAEVHHTLGDLRRSREIGPEMAQYVKAQADLQEKFEDAKIHLLKQFLPLVTSILNGITLLARGVDANIQLSSIALKTLAFDVEGAHKALREFVEGQKDKDIKDPTETLLRGGVEVPLL